MDENGNGRIDLEEMQGRARYFLERMERDGQIRLDRPIPVDDLIRIMRERMSRYGSSSSSSSDRGSSDRSRDDSSRSDSSVRTASATTAVPLVPGFGADVTPDAPLGFGPIVIDPLAALAQRYDSRIIERVREALTRYDRNGDNMLDWDELRNARWSGDPRDFDFNKDGKLSPEEIAERYHQREYGSGGSSSSSSSSTSSTSSSSGYSRYGGPPGPGGPGGPGGPPGGPGGYGGYGWSRGGEPVAITVMSAQGPPGSPAPGSGSRGPSSGSSSSNSGGNASLDPRYVQYAEGMLRQYDTNRDGKLQKDEWSRMRNNPEAADTNKDGIITREELAAWLNSFSRERSGGDSRTGDPRGGDPRASSGGGSSTRATAVSSDARKSYRFLSPLERLPEGLPDWFTRQDANGDGQVMMHEFTTTWTDAKAAEFAAFDLNGDGVITAEEAIAAAANAK